MGSNECRGEDFAQAWQNHISTNGETRYRHLQPTLEEMFDDLRGKWALDAGCGDGAFTGILHKKGAELVVAQDINVNLLVNLIGKYPTNTIVEIYDLTYHRPHRDPFFDAFLCCNVLMSLSDNEAISSIKELNQRTKDRGYGVVAIVHPLYRFFEARKEPKSYSENKEIKALGITEYLRPVGWYADQFTTAGFSIERFKEVMVPQDETSPRYISKKGWPLFAVFKLKKN